MTYNRLRARRDPFESLQGPSAVSPRIFRYAREPSPGAAANDEHDASRGEFMIGPVSEHHATPCMRGF
jgi:hypothetical protein